MKTKILAELERTHKEFVQVLSAFSPEQINQAPSEGSWTAGQVAEHVIKSVSGVAYRLRGKVQPADRPSDEKIGPIRALFLDFTIKMKSPEFIIPEMKPYQEEQLILDMEKGMGAIAEIVQRAEEEDGWASALAQVCLDFEFPGLGFLTRTEWIHVTLFHTQRHTHQLQNILHMVQQGKALPR